jgi:teichuronic acid biosynthesis glycosyltransferase TuaC
MTGAQTGHADRRPEPTTAVPEPFGTRVLVFTTLFPNPAQPLRGVFVRHRVAALARHCPTRVVAPILERGGGWGRRRRARAQEHAALEVSHPPYTTVPLVGRCTDGVVLYLQVLAHMRRLHAEFPFDVIDAHYAFPDGAAATLLAAHFGVPVAVTVRGGDLDLLPRFRLRRRAITRTLRRADRIFAVSQHIAARAVELGASPRSILVVPNGVDPATFSYADSEAARRTVGAPAGRPLLLCVANLLAEKGQHVLIEAFARMQATAPEPWLVLIGSDPSPLRVYRRRLERLIARHHLGQRIRLLGSVDQDALRHWYHAADVLVLPTFREGSPNVVREALACGTPVVGSRVGGVPELIASEEMGLLVEPGDVDGLARRLDEALRRVWDRPMIAARAGGSDWQSVGLTLGRELARLAAQRPGVVDQPD